MGNITAKVTGAVNPDKLMGSMNVEGIMNGTASVDNIESMSNFSLQGLVGQTKVGSKLIEAQNAVVNSQIGQAVMGAKDRLMNSEIVQKATATKEKLIGKVMDTPQVKRITDAGQNAMNGLVEQMTGIDMSNLNNMDPTSIKMPDPESISLDNISLPDFSAKISDFGDSIGDKIANISGGK